MNSKGIDIVSIVNSPNNTQLSFVPVDTWEPIGKDNIVSQIKGYFIAPISTMFLREETSDDKLNCFSLAAKKCYNSDEMRFHLCKYINYFCKYYDQDLEYLSILFILKTKIDRYETSAYPIDHFFADLERYILRSNVTNKAWQMVEDNYCRNLRYSNIKNPNLQYTNDHAKILHAMSMLMNLCIPLLTQYAFIHKVEAIDSFLMAFYDRIIYMRPDINIYRKLYDTAFTNVVANQKSNQGLWVKQDIRSTDTVTHSRDCVNNIILNIMPKYTFCKNIISFNYSSIHKNTRFKITDISYEFSFIPISSSKRDDDSVSDFDKFESNLIRMNEGLYLQNVINYQYCIKTIENVFGPFDKDEVEYYTKRILIDADGNVIINSFQKQLLFGLFYRWFGDTQSIGAINREDYVKLMIAAKKLSISKNMIILPYIISGKVEKLVQRKNVNKKEKLIVESSPSYPLILEKYKNENIVNHILSIIATIISSDFSIVDMDPEIDGKHLDLDTVAVGVIIEEIELFILMV